MPSCSPEYILLQGLELDDPHLSNCIYKPLNLCIRIGSTHKETGIYVHIHSCMLWMMLNPTRFKSLFVHSHTHLHRETHLNTTYGKTNFPLKITCDLLLALVITDDIEHFFGTFTNGYKTCEGMKIPSCVFVFCLFQCHIWLCNVM